MGKIHKNVTNFCAGPIDKTGSRVYTVEIELALNVEC